MMEPSLTPGACFDLVEHGLRRARDLELVRHMFSYELMEVSWPRRCQLCAKTYVPERAPMVKLFDDRPPRCADCMEVINRVAVEARALFSGRLDPDLIAQFAARYITHQPFQFGRPWQDHVPASRRYLIKDIL